MRRKGERSQFILRSNLIRLLAGMLWLSGGVWAEEVAGPVVINPVEAGGQVGKEVTVRGKVEGQKVSKGGHTYLNFGGRFPNHVFSCFLSGKNFPEPIPSFEGKEVEVTGLVGLYEGKAQMEITGLSQIRVVEEVGKAEAAPSQGKP